MALTILTRVKETIGLGVTDVSKDAELAAIIERVSRSIETQCGRVFEHQAAITEYHDGDGISQTLLLRQAPVTAITSVHVDAARTFAASTLIDAADYVVDAESGLLSLDGFAFSRGLQAVKVVYSAGYTVIPQDLEEAALAICAETFWDVHGELKALVGDQIVERVASFRKRARESINRYVRWGL